tara:strand:- start:173 stop:409 length:237 start_codon:yes stop_codon:yes gene_type:complete
MAIGSRSYVGVLVGLPSHLWRTLMPLPFDDEGDDVEVPIEYDEDGDDCADFTDDEIAILRESAPGALPTEVKFYHYLS